MTVLVDTNILIDFSKGFDFLPQDTDLAVCPVTVAEFLNNRNLKTKSEIRRAEEFMRSFRCFELDRETGELAGHLMKSRSVGQLGDALIAAVCLNNDLYLLTRNKKHFEKVAKVKFYPVETKRKS